MRNSANMNKPPEKTNSSQGTPLRRFKHGAMGCTYELALVCDDPAYASQAARAVFAEIDRLERELSHFIPTSDIARINALPLGRTIRIGIEALECLQLAEQICRDTGGAFDVTYASKVAPGQIPHPSGKAQSGPAALLELDTQGRYIRVRAAGVRVDLGGIGKGYAVDQVLTILNDWQIEAGLIHSGQSSIYALGTPTNAEHWAVSLRDPLDHEKTLGWVTLKNNSLSGSGRKLHGDHIIDPRTGKPAVKKLATWALAPSASVSDALSTAFMIMSLDEIEVYCQHHKETSALVIEASDDRRTTHHFGTDLRHITP